MPGGMSMEDHELGIVGLATMGMNLARNLASHGVRVAVFNRTRHRTDEFMASYGAEGDFRPAATLEELVHILTPPRAILLMVKAGSPVDEGIDALSMLLEPADMLNAIAAKVDGVPCCTYIGPDGAGHFVKMVHNGIEYADIQLIAETYDLLRSALGLPAGEIAAIFREWNNGRLQSYLIEITSHVLAKHDDGANSSLVDAIEDEAEQ